MKKAGIILTIVMSCLIVVNLSFSRHEKRDAGQSPAYSLVNEWYTAHADSFLQSLIHLQTIHRHQAGLPVFARDFAQCRRHFKQMEMLVSYFDKRVYLGLNQQVRPEVELEKGVFEYVQEPHGLQVIESALAGKKSYSGDSLSIERELDMAISTARFLKTYHFTRPFTDTGFYNAIMEATVRLASLGISGFDKPVLDDGLTECARVLAGVGELVDVYRLVNLNDAVAIRLLDTVNRATVFIKKHGRNTAGFDRLTFVRDFLQPIYASAFFARESFQYRGSSQNTSDITRSYSFFQRSVIDGLYHQRPQASPGMIALGKTLFESPVMSGNGTLSCTSCHHPGLDFADTVQHNTGFLSANLIARNTPGLVNSTYSLRFQRDGHQFFMQDQFREVLSSHIEMGNTTEADLLQRVRKMETLSTQCAAQFQVSKEEISYPMILVALEAFVRSLVSLDTPFDRYMNYATNTITAPVKRGFNLFMGKAKCGTCHFLPVFNGVMPPDFDREENEVIGVLENSDFKHPVLSKDPGLFNATKQDLHQGSFKVPSVRNMAKTFPYMHNGSLRTLDDLLLFYDMGGGGGNGTGIVIPNQTLDHAPLKLSKKERDDIKAFLMSLN